MKITVSCSGNETKLVVLGCLDTAATAEFDAAVDKAAEKSGTIVFDFAGIEFIASSALRKLVSVDKMLSASGGGIVIEGMSDVVREVFDITGLNEVFKFR